MILLLARRESLGYLSSAKPSPPQEHAAKPEQELVMDLGVNPTEDVSSEQTVSSGSSGRWTAYQSPLQSYPFSRWHLHLTGPNDVSTAPTVGGSSGLSILTPSGSFSSNSAGGSGSVDSREPSITGSLVRSLKMVTLFKSLDPDRRICQFEIPGGGVCRDDKCEDLHVERELERWEPSGASRVHRDGVLLTLCMLAWPAHPFALLSLAISPFPPR